MKSTLKDGGGKNLLFESTIFTGILVSISSRVTVKKTGLQLIALSYQQQYY